MPWGRDRLGRRVKSGEAHPLQGVDREQLRRWYNGYNFLGEKLVYNPHDILHFESFA